METELTWAGYWPEGPPSDQVTGLDVDMNLSCALHANIPRGVWGQKLSLCSEVKSLSRVRPFVTPWIVAHQASPSMGFPRQQCWSGLPFPVEPRGEWYCGNILNRFKVVLS